ncbi:MAG: putative lipid II flippase FtsW [Planctomycetota bacterium]|nr:putative lipid II flippase FtsW [Planctomycetota bacterium]
MSGMVGEGAENLRRRRSLVIMIVAALTSFGIIMIYSASSTRATRNGGLDAVYAWTQLIWLGVAVVAMIAMATIPHRCWLRLRYPIITACCVLLVLVMTPLGTRVNGANRWFRFSHFNIQASELAKIGMIVAFAGILAGIRDGRPLFFRHVLPLCAVSGLAVALIAVEPDFGTAFLLAAGLGGLLLAGGTRVWQLLLLAAPAVPVGAWYGMARYDHIIRRIEDWLSGAASHTNASKIAIGSGGLWGVGLGQGPAKLDYLPEAHTDFIFAIIGQELGLMGTLSVIALFVMLVWQGMGISARAEDRFGSLLAFGITLLIGGQAIFNIGVATGLLPPKGISLPFVSFGGSGLVVFYSMAGLLASVASGRRPRAIMAGTVDESNPIRKYRPLPAFKTTIIMNGETDA